MYNFTYEQLTNGAGVQLIPPKNSDWDMDITGTVTVANVGGTRDYPANFTIDVDAVADKPTGMVVDLIGVTEYQAGEHVNDSTEAKIVGVEFGVTFGDVVDTSERQYIEVKGIPNGWEVIEDSLPGGWSYLGTVTLPDGSVVYRFDVTEAARAAADADTETGSIHGKVEFNPGDWTSTGAQGPDGTTDWGRDNAGKLYIGSDAVLSVRGVAEDSANDNDPDPDNNISYGDWSDSTQIVIVEDIPEFTYDQAKANQDLPVDDVVANLGVGEAAGASAGHGSGEFSFHGENNPSGYNLSPSLSDLIKDFVANNSDNTPNQNTPLGINHAYGDGSNSAASNPGSAPAGRGGIQFDLLSDGIKDGSTGPDGIQSGSQGVNSEVSLAWAHDPDTGKLLPTAVGAGNAGAKADLDMYSKVTSEIAQETDANRGLNTGYHNGYAQLQFEVAADNPQLMYGYFYNNAGEKVIAIVGVLTPNYEKGYADVTFVEYTPLYHPDAGADGKGVSDSLQSYFQVQLTDDDGDVVYGNVQYRVSDDVAKAGSSQTALFDEKNGDGGLPNGAIGGNLLDKRLDDHDINNDGAKYTDAKSGSDGWADDGTGTPGGVVSFNIELPDGYTLDGYQGNVLNNLKPGTYTILDAKGNPQGILEINPDGEWSFGKIPGSQDVIKDFNFKVTYTVQDADGDQDTASLNVNVNASPVMVGITGSEQVFESTTAGSGSGGDTVGRAEYTLNVLGYDGQTQIKGDALYEDIFVTIKINPGTASLADLDLKSIGISGGTIVKIEDDGSLVIRIPKGSDGEVKISLPMSDDRSGGYGTDENGYTGKVSDSPVEDYTVEVTQVTGGTSDHYLQPGDPNYNAKGVDTSQKTEIIDDGTNVTWNDKTGRWDVDGYQDNRLDYGSSSTSTSYDHAKDPHPLDGPMFGLVAPVGNVVNEGVDANAVFHLSAKDPNSVSGADYSGTLADDVFITLSLENLTTNASDLGKITLSGGGLSNANLIFNDDGTVTIKLPANYNMANLKNVEIRVPITNDNRGETDEKFSLSISEVSGNESTYYGKESVVTVKDPYSNKLLISGDDTQWEGGSLSYTLTLKTTAAVTGSNTDKVTAILDFSGTATRGEDYNLGDIINANKHLTFKNVDGSPIDPADKSTWPTNGKVMVEVDATDWAAGSKKGSDGYYDNTVKLNVPTSHDNQIGENDETVVIKIDSASGAEITQPDPGKGIEGGWGGEGKGTIQDRGELTLTAPDGSQKTGNIYEDEHLGNTVATYQVNFKHDDGLGKGALHEMISTENGDVAGSAFTFDISVKDGLGDNGAKFDSNMLDNVDHGGKDANTHDYGWAVPTFDAAGNITGYELIEYGDLNNPANHADLIDAIN